MLLGIDIGTSSVKAVLFDPEGEQVIASAGQEYPIHKPAPDRAEQNPDDWWNATVSVVQQVIHQTGADVTAISLTGQMHGPAFIGEDHTPIHPAIIWADQRSADVIDTITDLIGAERWTHITGTLPAAGFMSATLYWLAQHDPDLLARTHRVILPKDYILLKLTGELSTDVSDAAATSLFDVTEIAWSQPIIEALGIPPDIFPAVLPSDAVAGQVRPDAAALLGIRAGVPVVAGCSDQPAQAIANGLTTPDKAAVTLGTGGQVFVPVIRQDGQALPVDRRIHVFNHAVPGMWYELGAILSGGLSLRWLRNTLGVADYATLSAEASDVPPGASGLIFLPYLFGERTPHMDAQARGAFIGLSYDHTRAHMARAVMEGVAFAMRQTLEICLELSREARQNRPVQIIAAGGAMDVPLWRGIMADVLNRPLRRSLIPDQSPVGAALLAGAGTGVYADIVAASRAEYGEPTPPEPANVDHYEALYQQYARLYPLLRGEFHSLFKTLNRF